MKINNGAWRTSVSNPSQFSRSGNLGGNIPLVFRADTQTTGTKTADIRCLDSGIEAASGEVSRTFTVLPSPFEAIIGNATKVKAAHISALRTAVNTIRAYYGLSVVSWNEDISPGKTEVKNWPFHILEIRRATEPIITHINSYDTASTFDMPEVDWLPLGNGRPGADVMNQLQDLLLSL